MTDDMDAKIYAHVKAVHLGLKAALQIVRSHKMGDAAALILSIYSDTLAKEDARMRNCLTKPAQSDLPPSSSDTIPQEAHND